MPVEAILWSICVVLLPYCNFFSNTLGVPFLLLRSLTSSKFHQTEDKQSVFKVVKGKSITIFLGGHFFSPFDLTEHDWLPIESLFRFIVFAQRIACWWQAWKSCAFSLWFILGVGVVIYIYTQRVYSHFDLSSLISMARMQSAQRRKSLLPRPGMSVSKWEGKEVRR